MNEHPIEREDGTGFNVTAPGGFSASVKNVDKQTFLVVLLIFAAIAFVYYILHDHESVSAEQNTTTQKLIASVIANQQLIIKGVQDARKDAADSSDVIAYVLTRTEKQRAALNLDEPAALRKKRRRDNGDN